MVSGATSIHSSRHPLTHLPRVRFFTFFLLPQIVSRSHPYSSFSTSRRQVGLFREKKETEGRHMIDESMSDVVTSSSTPTISPARTSTSASPRIKRGMHSLRPWSKTAHNSPKPTPLKARSTLFLFNPLHLSLTAR